MANEFYTFIFVPHAKARFRKFQIPVKLAHRAALTGGALTLALAGVLVHYTWLTSQVVELRTLRSHNEALLAKTREYESNAGKLQAKVLALQSTVNKLGVMAGLEQVIPDGVVGGTGGAPTADLAGAPALSLGSMEGRVSELTRKSQKIEEIYQSQKVLLASTPSIWPVRGYLSSNFGNRIDPFTGQRDFHPGIDISTPSGTKVVAPADAVVVSAGVKGAYGNAIVLEHGFGIITHYGHLDGFNVRAGQRVRRGEVIGFVGTTGRSTSPHLHYEVWVRDQAQNPIQYILDEFRSFG